MEIGLMLKEVHVPPGVFTGVMYRAFLATDRASEAAARREVDVQVQPLFFHREGHMIHQPRRNQPYRQGKQFFLDHHQLFPAARLLRSILLQFHMIF
jgi:hypothetical protein